MPIKINGTTLGSSNNLTFNGTQANYATLNGTIVWQRQSSVPFTVADTGASFSVSTTTVSWTPPSVGTLVGSPTYSNGQNLGTVSTNTNRTQNFTVTVPNDPQWSNANQNVAFSLSDIQEATVLSPPVFTSFTATQSSLQVNSAHLSWSINNQGYPLTGSIVITYNGSTQTSVSNTASGAVIYGLDPGTTEFISISASSSQGTGSSSTSVAMLEEFTFSDGFVANSFAVNSNGVPSGTLQGGATNISFNPSTFDLSCTSISRSSTISFSTPSGYWNSTASNLQSATQPGYGQPAIAASMSEVSGSLTNISASGSSGAHSITITNPTSVGEWNVAYSGTGITPAIRTGCGDRSSLSWTVAANSGAARSGTITLYAGSTQTTVLDTLSWSQLAGSASYYSHSFTKGTSESNVCAGTGTSVTVYSNSSSGPIANGDLIYSNTALTTLAPSGYYSDGTDVGYWSGTSWSSVGLCGFGGGGL